MKPRIAAITGKLEDTVISMTEGPVLIGRQAGATLKIGNASVSRRHAIIERDGDRFVIADLGSRNGTFVNDVPIRRRELQHGDRVRIGDSQFFFLYEETDEPARNIRGLIPAFRGVEHLCGTEAADRTRRHVRRSAAIPGDRPRREVLCL